MAEFGAYEVMAEVATGTSGRVFRARHRELGREAAVKELGEWVRSTPGALAGLRSEAAVLAQLDHPNVVALYDYVEEPGRAWLAEQWVEGAPLSRILALRGRLTPEQALGVVRGAVTGLAYAHDRGVVHRDVSVGNILADLAGTSMLVDFGLAGPAGVGTVLGTPGSISPEAARGETVGKPGDVYSAAAVLYQLLRGRPVFDGNAAQVVTAHRDRPAPSLTEHGPDLASLVGRALSKDPGDRPPDAGAFLTELEAAAERSYGAGWIERASIAGLVTAAAAGGAAVTVAVDGGGRAGPTVVFDEARAPLSSAGGAPTPLVPRRVSGLKWAMAGTAAALVVGGGAVVTLAAGDDDPDDRSDAVQQVADERDSPEPSAAPEPTPDETQPAGRYRGTLRFTRIVPGNGAVDASVRQPEKRVWTFTPAGCSDKACKGSVSSNSGASFDYRWDGRALSVREDDVPITAGCTFDDGSPAPGTLRARLRTAIDLTAPRGESAPQRIDIAVTTTVLSYRDDSANDCTWNRPIPKFWVKSGTLRKVG